MDAQELIERFSVFDDLEERYAYLIEMGRKLPPMPAELKTEESRVRGCVSQVWLVAEQRGGVWTFVGDSDAFIVKGLVALVFALVDGRTSEEIQRAPLAQVFDEIGLAGQLTVNRRNGFQSMVEKIRRLTSVPSPG